MAGLLALLDPSASVAVRRAAARGLAVAAPRKFAPQLAKNLAEETDRGVKLSLLQTLGRLGDDEALPALLLALKDREPLVCEEAALALSRYNSEAAYEALLASLRQNDDDRSWSARRYAAEALGRLSDPRAVPALIEALRDDNPLVRPAVALALGRLGDKEAVAALKRVRHTTPHQRGAECAECKAIDAALRQLENKI